MTLRANPYVHGGYVTLKEQFPHENLNSISCTLDTVAIMDVSPQWEFHLACYFLWLAPEGYITLPWCDCTGQTPPIVKAFVPVWRTDLLKKMAAEPVL